MPKMTIEEAKRRDAEQKKQFVEENIPKYENYQKQYEQFAKSAMPILPGISGYDGYIFFEVEGSEGCNRYGQAIGDSRGYAIGSIQNYINRLPVNDENRALVESYKRMEEKMNVMYRKDRITHKDYLSCFEDMQQDLDTIRIELSKKERLSTNEKDILNYVNEMELYAFMTQEKISDFRIPYVYQLKAAHSIVHGEAMNWLNSDNAEKRQEARDFLFGTANRKEQVLSKITQFAQEDEYFRNNLVQKAEINTTTTIYEIRSYQEGYFLNTVSSRTPEEIIQFYQEQLHDVVTKLTDDRALYEADLGDVFAMLDGVETLPEKNEEALQAYVGKLLKVADTISNTYEKVKAIDDDARTEGQSEIYQELGSMPGYIEFIVDWIKSDYAKLEFERIAEKERLRQEEEEKERQRIEEEKEKERQRIEEEKEKERLRQEEEEKEKERLRKEEEEKERIRKEEEEKERLRKEEEEKERIRKEEEEQQKLQARREKAENEQTFFDSSSREDIVSEQQRLRKEKELQEATDAYGKNVESIQKLIMKTVRDFCVRIGNGKVDKEDEKVVNIANAACHDVTVLLILDEKLKDLKNDPIEALKVYNQDIAKLGDPRRIAAFKETYSSPTDDLLDLIHERSGIRALHMVTPDALIKQFIPMSVEKYFDLDRETEQMQKVEDMVADPNFKGKMKASDYERSASVNVQEDAQVNYDEIKGLLKGATEELEVDIDIEKEIDDKVNQLNENKETKPDVEKNEPDNKEAESENKDIEIEHKGTNLDEIELENKENEPEHKSENKENELENKENEPDIKDNVSNLKENDAEPQVQQVQQVQQEAKIDWMTVADHLSVIQQDMISKDGFFTRDSEQYKTLKQYMEQAIDQFRKNPTMDNQRGKNIMESLATAASRYQKYAFGKEEGGYNARREHRLSSVRKLLQYAKSEKLADVNYDSVKMQNEKYTYMSNLKLATDALQDGKIEQGVAALIYAKVMHGKGKTVLLEDGEPDAVTALTERLTALREQKPDLFKQFEKDAKSLGDLDKLESTGPMAKLADKAIVAVNNLMKKDPELGGALRDLVQDGPAKDVGPEV